MTIKNLTLKIQGQGHGRGQRLKSQLGSNILSTRPLIPMIELFKIWPSKSKVKVMAQGHIVCIISYRLISLRSLLIGSPFLRYSYLKIDLENPKLRSGVKSKFKVTMWVLHPMDSHSFWFHVNQPSHSWDIAFSKFDLENQGSWSNDHDIAQLQVWRIPQNL